MRGITCIWTKKPDMGLMPNVYFSINISSHKCCYVYINVMMLVVISNLFCLVLYDIMEFFNLILFYICNKSFQYTNNFIFIRFPGFDIELNFNRLIFRKEIKF